MSKIPTFLFAPLLVAFVCLGLSQEFSPAAGQPPSIPPSTGRAGGGLLARVVIHNRAELEALSSLDIWEVHLEQGYLLAMLSSTEYDALQEAGYTLAIDEERTAALAATAQRPVSASGIPGYACYRTVEETLARLEQMAADYPGLAQTIDIGDSWEKSAPGGLPGYDLLLLKLTNQAIPGPKPAFFLMAAIHAREYATAELGLRFAESLLQAYGVEAEATWLLDHFELHLLAIANPDGRKLAEGGQLWRKNTNPAGCSDPYAWGVDLNRNHSYAWGGLGATTYACGETYRGPAAASEVEIQAIQNYVAALFPDQRGPGAEDAAPPETSGVFLSLHSYGQLVLWPWGYTDSASPNQAGLQTLGRKLAFYNNYYPEQAMGFYPTSGTSDDWAYGELGVAAYTIELGSDFFQDCQSFENNILPQNLQALRTAFKAARRPYQTPAGPEVLNLELSNVGEAITLTAQADDRLFAWGENYQTINAARYSWDVPSWQASRLFPLPAADGSFDSAGETLAAPVEMACLPEGRHTLFLEAQDADGNWGAPGAAFLEVGVYASPALSPTQQSASGAGGMTVSYQLEAANLGNSAIPFTLSVQSEWAVSPLPAKISLAACERLTLEIEVSIPGADIPGSEGVTTIRLASPARAAEARLQTRRIVQSFLPLILSSP